MRWFNDDGFAGSVEYGDKFWVIETPSGYFNLCADELKLEDGHIVAYCHSSNNERFIGICLPPGEWITFWAASFMDGSPVVVDISHNNNGDEKTRRQRPSSRVKEILMTNGGRKCAKCGKSEGDGIKLHIDHIIPLAMGGTNSIHNLQILCSNCNMTKSDKLE